MRKLLLVAMLLLLNLSASVAAQQSGRVKEEALIKQTVQYYFDGLDNFDVESMKKAFHPKAKWFTIRYGGLQEITLPRVYSNMRSSSRERIPRGTSRWRIVAVDVANDAASVKVEIEHAAGKITEYLSLIKFDDGWKIVSKILTGEGIARPANDAFGSIIRQL